MTSRQPFTDGFSEPLHVWDVPEGIERKRRLRNGEFDSIPRMRWWRTFLMVLAIACVASFGRVLAALIF
jgi:hypothetical protein